MRRTTRKEITDAYRARAAARQAGRRREARERSEEQSAATVRTMIDHRQVSLEEGVGERREDPTRPDPLHPTRWPWWG